MDMNADSCRTGAVRCFSPVLFAIGAVLSLISPDQGSTWYPTRTCPAS